MVGDSIESLKLCLSDCKVFLVPSYSVAEKFSWKESKSRPFLCTEMHVVLNKNMCDLLAFHGNFSTTEQLWLTKPINLKDKVSNFQMSP